MLLVKLSFFFRCKQWVKATGNEDLINVPIEKLHQLKYICGKHFECKYFKKKNTQLKNQAVPTLYITARPLTDDMFEGFPLHVAKDVAHFSDHNYCSYSEKPSKIFFLTL